MKKLAILSADRAIAVFIPCLCVGIYTGVEMVKITLSKILFIFLVLAIAYGGIQTFRVNSRNDEINTLKTQINAIEGNNKILTEQLEREHNDKVELSRKYTELEEKAKSDTSFDWYADISRSPVVLQLQRDKD